MDGEGPERNQGADEFQRRLLRRNDDRSRKWEFPDDLDLKPEPRTLSAPDTGEKDCLENRNSQISERGALVILLYGLDGAFPLYL